MIHQQQILTLFPDIEYDEVVTLMEILQKMDEDTQQQFLRAYDKRRRKAFEILLLTVLGFFGIAGVHRMVTGHIGLGIVYLFTGGLFLIGTIVDLINYKNITSKYNRQQAVKLAAIISGKLFYY